MRRLVWLIPLLLFVFLILGLVGLSQWVRGYLHSEAFRELVTSRTNQTLNVSGQFTPFEWSGSSVYSETYSGSGSGDALWQDLDAKRIRAEINWRSMFDGAWRIEQLTLGSVSGRMNPAATQQNRVPGGREEEGGAEPSRETGPGGILPSRFEIGSVRIDETFLEIPSPLGPIVVEKLQLEASQNANDWELTGSGGTVRMPGFPEPLKVAVLKGRSRGTTFFLSESDLRLDSGGQFLANGEFSPTGEGKLHLAWHDLPLSVVLEEPWKTRLTGMAHGVADWRGARAGLEGSFEITEAELRDIPLQKQLASFTGQPKFERMPIQVIRGKFEAEGQAMRVREFEAESRGLIRLEGDYSVDANRTLDGTLQVGVTPQTLQWLPGSREKVFTEERNGYVWTSVRLQGTIDQPKEDLTPRLAQAMGEATIEAGIELIESAPAETQEAVKKGLDLLNSFLE